MDIEHQQPTGGFTLRDIAHILFKRKWLIILFFLTTALTGTLVTLVLSTTVYEATSQLLIRPGREHMTDLTVPSNALPPRVVFDLEEQTSRAIEMLTGRYLVEQTVRQIGARELYREAINWPLPILAEHFREAPVDDQVMFERVVKTLQQNLHAERVGLSALINISYKHEDPAMAALVVNTLGNLFVERHLGVLKNPGGEAFLKEQFASAQERLNGAQKTLESFKAQNGISSTLKEEHEISVRQLTSLQAEVHETTSHEAEIDSRLAQLRSQISNTAQDPDAIATTRAKLLEMELEESKQALRLAPQNPTMIALRGEIAKLRDRLTRLEGNKAYGTSAQREGGLYPRLQEEILKNEAELRATRARKTSQMAKLAELQAKVQRIDHLEPEFERLQQREQMEQQNYKLYQTKSEEARISKVMDEEKITSVKVIDTARTPNTPVNNKLVLKLLLPIVFGLVGGLVLAFLLELFSDKLETAERVESVLGAPVLASIPNLKLKG